MATATDEKKQGSTATQTMDAPGFGAYGAAGGQPDLRAALEKEPEAKRNGSVDFTVSDKRWLKDIGITTSDPNSYHKAWESAEDKHNRDHLKWNETYGGRLAMRSISRGIVGAAFYATAQIYAGKAMRGYTATDDPKGVLQHITRFIDNTVGKSIQWTVKAVTGDEAKALKAVTFRDTFDYGYKAKDGVTRLMGRSLGHETVGVTFDFAAMSFGDYMTRYTLGLMDPNARVKWMKNGHMNVPGALKDLFQNVFRGITYAAGEDMAVAVPYVYGLRLQRNIIDKASPGFKYDSDRSLNGGSFKVDAQGKIVGDYQLEGALDLMGRFSWYNVGTKMFRDAYSGVAKKVNQWWDGDRSIHMPTIDARKLTPARMADAVGDGIRYVLRTTIKVMGYMLPATAFFFATRTPQSKYIGLAINPEKGPLGFVNAGGGFSYIQADGSHRAKGGSIISEGSESPHKRVSFAGDTGQTFENVFEPDRSGGYEHRFDPFAHNEHTWHGKITNKIGRFNYDAGTALNEFIMPLGRKMGFSANTVNLFARKDVNAALSYMPYFMMKTDILSAEWDTKRMDMALDRMLTGIGRLKWGEFRAGIGEVMRATMREPFSEPKREQLAQDMRWGKDPEHSSNEAFQLNGVGAYRNTENRENYYTARGNEQKSFVDKAVESRRSQPLTMAQLKPRDASWADAMRKFQETPAQGQSVH